MLTLFSEKCIDIQVSIMKALTIYQNVFLSLWASMVIRSTSEQSWSAKATSIKKTEEEEPKAIPLSEHCFVATTFVYLQSRLVLSIKNYQNHPSL